MKDLRYRNYRKSKKKEKDFAVVLAFAAGYEELVNRIKDIGRKHTLYVPDVPVIGTGLFDYDYCTEHARNLKRFIIFSLMIYQKSIFINTGF